MNWYVGQRVYCLRLGEGVITKFYNHDGEAKMEVQFSKINCMYRLDGRLRKDDATPMLYHAKPEITVPKWQPKECDWCWFWDVQFDGAFLAKFEKMQDDVFFDREGNCWQNCAPFNGELPEHLKEVEK